MKELLIWKSRTTLDYYRILWVEDTGFVAYYQDRDDEWMAVETSYTAEQVIEWIESGNVEQDILVI